MRSLPSRALLSVVTAAVLSVLAVSFLAQPPRPADAASQERPSAQGGNASDEQAIRKAGAAYLDALNKGDLTGLMAAWTPDADYIDVSGTVTRGTEALTALF